MQQKNPCPLSQLLPLWNIPFLEKIPTHLNKPQVDKS